MIVRKFRLPPSVVFSSPVTVSEKEFIMKTQKNNLEYSRFGFVVGKSVDKLATKRNSIKRQFRAFFEKKQLLGGQDTLFVLRAAIQQSHKNDIEKKIEAALRKVGLL